MKYVDCCLGCADTCIRFSGMMQAWYELAVDAVYRFFMK